ncbi:MAG: U32 family peptidase [Clostridiaceae bacterium]|nr:U32 family peptidase [Clostridiaceae bacterium]
MNQKVELLAPAGNFDSLKAAVNAGADAVYAGAKNFNARAGADNFDEKALSEAIGYCRSGGVKFFLVLNTLIHDREIKDALKTLESAYRAGIDAVIVQDIGLMRLIKSHFSDLEIHASTQTTVYDLNGVYALHEAGASRVILARECSMEQIKNIAQKSPAEIEIFVHGAMCVSYSGQCLMSSFIGGRSGNRGCCAQPCRLDYSLCINKGAGYKEIKKGPLLSIKDLSMIEYLPRVVSSGVKSLKIEGRMRSPEYVACTVSVYRKYLDRALQDPENYRTDEKDYNDLLLIFNRGKMWPGYAFKKDFPQISAYSQEGKEGVYVGKAVKSPKKRDGLLEIAPITDIESGDGLFLQRPSEDRIGFYVSSIQDLSGKRLERAAPGQKVLIGNVKNAKDLVYDVYKTYDRNLHQRMKKIITGKPYRTVKIPLFGTFIAKLNEKPVLIVQDSEGNIVRTEGDERVEKADKAPVLQKDAEDRLKRTGDTPFVFETLRTDMDENIYISLTALNRLRREALEKMDFLRNKTRREFRLGFEDQTKACNTSYEKAEPAWNGMFYTFNKDTDYTGFGLDEVTLPLLELDEEIIESLGEKLKNAGMKFNAFIPAITGENASCYLESLLVKGLGRNLDGIYCGNMGSVELLKRYGYVNIMGDIGLNVFNRYTAEYLKEKGLIRITPSVELNKSETEELVSVDPKRIELVVYGRIPLMTLAYYPTGGMKLCGLQDRKKCSFHREEISLSDRMNKRYDMFYTAFDCGVQILSADPLRIRHELSVGSNRLIFHKETRDQIRKIVAGMKDPALWSLTVKTDTGHWGKGV